METMISLGSIARADLKNMLREIIRELWKEDEHEKKTLPEILDVNEAAAFLKYQVTTLHEKTHKKLIPHYKKGNKLFFYRSELDAWIREGKVKSKQELESEAVTYTLTKRHKYKKAA